MFTSIPGYSKHREFGDTVTRLYESQPDGRRRMKLTKNRYEDILSYHWAICVKCNAAL